MPDGRTILFGLPGVGVRHVEHVVDHPLRGSSCLARRPGWCTW